MNNTNEKPLVMHELTKEQFDLEIAKGMADVENGRLYSAEELKEEMNKWYTMYFEEVEPDEYEKTVFRKFANRNPDFQPFIDHEQLKKELGL